MHDHGVGPYERTGQKEYLINAAVGAGGKPADIFRDQGAETLDTNNHGAPLDGGNLERI